MKNRLATCLALLSWAGFGWGDSLPSPGGSGRKEPQGGLSFTRDVIPVLTKAGCNSGACHGSFQGRGGFRLSLLGFHPKADYDALVHEARGRRVLAAAPQASLILLKPTATVSHGGGKRLVPGTESYRVLRDWIAGGLPGPKSDDPQVQRLELIPPDILSEPGEKTSLQVMAHWSDGLVQESTSWALYESTATGVAEVDAAGTILAHAPGRAAVTIRFMGQATAVQVTVPYSKNVELASLERNNFIDDFVIREWEKVGLAPTPLATDAEFLRRAFLDLIGTLPTPEAIRPFLASPDPAKRSKLVEELLERPEYVDYWALKWGDLLRAHRRALGEKGLAAFNGWLRQSLRNNEPVDRMVRELLTAQGNLYTNGPVAFYYVDQTPQDLAETTAQVFLGVRLQCAKCHHHPYEVWSQDDYYGLAAFFARVERKDTLERGRYGGAQSVRLAPNGRVTNPETGQTVLPQLLGGSPLSEGVTSDPRMDLAKWVTDPSNRYFARNIVNRYWGYLFGRGLVEPIDDFRATNPALDPELLDALAADFTAHGYDLKHLLRTLCNSRVYQLASEIAPQRGTDGMFFTHRRPRRLPAEVLLDAINQAAGTEEKFNDTGRGRFGNANVPPGTRAIALPDPTVVSYFLDVFGRPNRTSTCECERGSKPDLSQVLHLLNSESLQQKLADPKGRVARLLAANTSEAEITHELYLATLARLPSDNERDTALKLVAEAPTRQQGFEDLLWTLLNSGEFVFNH